ncbi:hypothetical protein QNO07_25835 [Streptomyces sp. 549]|uniref:SCO4225 family membrane protein n=1 Tax=Streptomyces sp. 549 TaxID=3049076 RepID=UPI0024C27CA3|nr:hypothetical protein [Streptomyces sp. 549]MDK1476781.1 hypothetical protein [Streptomyces sp. 549]
MSDNNRVQGFLSAVAGNWVSRLYLAATLGLLIWAMADHAFVTHQDASFAAVVPLLATAPTSLLTLLLPEGAPAALFFAVIATAAVVNAALLGALTQRLLGRPVRA